MSDKAIGVGLIGCGTVGSGVVKLLVEEADVYAQRLGRPIVIRKVLVREQDKDYKTEQVPKGALVHDPDAFFADDGIDVVIELAGGKGAALTFVKRALEAGKHVVTANKALLAAHGPELFPLARKHGVALAFEASCGGGIPFITALQHNLTANRNVAMYGILNGTCNYILTQMIDNGAPYEAALAEAQAAGFAEADPTLDVSGGDSAHKLAVLASLAFGVSLTDDEVPCEGIDTLDLTDVRFGTELGYTAKLLAIAERFNGKLALGVAPCFLHDDDPLARIGGSFNAISLFGHAVGHTLYSGRGAGMMPTASAVVGDLINIACGAYTAAFANLRIWPDQHEPADRMDPNDITTRFYLRVNVVDVPGVMGRLTTILGEHDISISAVMQHEPQEDDEVHGGGDIVPVVITTHDAKAGALRAAVRKIAALDSTRGEPVVIRIVDLPEG
ncbi:MAG: homoserine dehydrogenase [Phycisphaera sp.]|nr:homoserine dehydrogenase [Phycisphaera sp.]